MTGTLSESELNDLAANEGAVSALCQSFVHSRFRSTRLMPIGCRKERVNSEFQPIKKQVEPDHKRETDCQWTDSAGSAFRVYDPCQDRDSDRRWNTAPGWSVFHSAAWADVLKNTYGFVPCFLELKGVDGRVSLMPLMEAHSLFFGKRGVSLPFSDTCPSLSASPEHATGLLRAGLEFARRRGWRYIELRGGSFQDELGKPSVDYYEHVLHLFEDEEQLLFRLRPECRTALRKACKSGLRIEIGTESLLVEQYYKLHCLTRHRHGVPVQPFKFFENIHRYLLKTGSGVVLLALHGEQPVAGAVFLHSGNTATYKFGASDPAYFGLRPNNLVMWEAIKWYQQRGYDLLHLGRTSRGQEGLRRFKLGWGARERALPYYRLNVREGEVMDVTDRSAGWQNQLFRFLPAFALRVSGRLLYRHVH